MIQKPKIQYVGQFYVHGSEARKLELEQKKAAPKRQTMERLQKIQRIYVDPVAVLGIAVAVVMLVTMVLGMIQIRDDWMAYNQMSSYVDHLQERNAELARSYRSKYNVEDLRTKANAMGLVPKAEVETIAVTVTIPEPEPEIGRIQQIKETLEGLFA